MQEVDQGRIVRILDEMADLAEVESSNPFRARAYRNAARTISGIAAGLDELIASGRVRELPGIGERIAAAIAEIAATGSCGEHRALLAEVPPGARRMLQVPGLGPKKARALWKEHGIASIDDLLRACRDGRIASLKGFGAKSQEKILRGIEFLESGAGLRLFPEIEDWAERIITHLRTSHAIERIGVGGGLRRRLEVAGEVELVAASSDPAAAAERFASFSYVEEITARGPQAVRARLRDGLTAGLRIASAGEFPFALLESSGSERHVAALRRRASELSFALDERGLFPAGGGAPLAAASEEDVYAALGLAYVPPELREDGSEIELAERGELPRLVDATDVRGVIHLHTTWSDGDDSIAAMAEAALARGYSYIGVSDHSQSAFYARGLDPERVRRQQEEIDAWNARGSGLRIFKGIESDIRPDGSLDYEDDILDSFDFVIASLHSSLDQGEAEMTRRVIRALEDPRTTILGHPTARLLLSRRPVAIDMDAVIEAAASLGVAIEINANPRRLDLDWRHGPRASDVGLFTSINPDAHSARGIDDIRFGVGIARKAGFGADRVINTFDAERFARFIRRRKS